VGTAGYKYAVAVAYEPGEIILEVGSGDSTRFLAGLGPPVVTIDADLSTFSRVAALDNVEAHHGRAEEVLRGWNRPIGFAWLDGWDWPYDGNPPDYYADQRAAYEDRDQLYSQLISMQSHLEIARLIADHVRLIAFDDTWRTHEFAFRSTDELCVKHVPPATTPALKLAMDQAIYRTWCGLERDHPHHDDPERGWNGKGGTAIPYLLTRGFAVVRYELGLVLLERIEDGA
jgi:hypothetical protein